MSDRLRAVLYPLSLVIMIGSLWAYAQAQSMVSICEPVIEHGLRPVEGLPQISADAAPMRVVTIDAEPL